MERPFDPTLKTLAELAPVDWLLLANRRRRRITIQDSDVSTLVSGASDKLFRVHDDPEYFLHLDFEAGHFRSDLPLRLKLYNSVFEYRHKRVVLSVPVLLTPGADSPQWSGLLQRGFPGETPVSTLRYEVIRVWKIPVEQLLSRGTGTLALAPISNLGTSDVQSVMRRIKERLAGPPAARRAADIWAATYVLLGLRYSDQLAKAIFEEVIGMKESATYQAIAREERAGEARRVLILQGEAKFGPLDSTTRAALAAITDIGQLEALAVRLVSADTWQKLLASRRRNGRRKSGN